MTEPSVNWTAQYPISDAENGKFVVLNMSGVTGYAQLSGNESFRGVRYAILTKSVDSGAEALTSDTIWIASSAIGPSLPYSPTPPATLSEIEIYNNSNNPIYLLLSGTNYPNVSTLGIVIKSGTYYTMQKNISSFTIGSSATSDVRIIGHYKS